jgi:hypothetical protein
MSVDGWMDCLLGVGGPEHMQVETVWHCLSGACTLTHTVSLLQVHICDAIHTPVPSTDPLLTNHFIHQQQNILICNVCTIISLHCYLSTVLLFCCGNKLLVLVVLVLVLMTAAHISPNVFSLQMFLSNVQ